MVLEGEHENTQGVFIFEGEGTEAPRGAGPVGREGCKRPPHMKNVPVWAHFTCVVAAGAWEATGEAPKGGVEEVWGGTRVQVEK